MLEKAIITKVYIDNEFFHYTVQLTMNGVNLASIIFKELHIKEFENGFCIKGDLASFIYVYEYSFQKMCL